MLYRIAKPIVNLFFHSYIRLDVLGHENIPRSEGVLLASNHISYLDPIILALAVKRQVHSMAKEELFKNAVLKSLMTQLNAFPVRRGRIDRASLKHSLWMLGEGNVLIIFPEGTIPVHGESKEGKPGVAWLALKKNVPVVPVKIIGSDKCLPVGSVFPRMGRVRIVFGEPISFDLNNRKQKDNTRIMTETIMEKIEKLAGL